MAYKNKEDLYRNQTFRWRRIKERAVEYKGGKCTECGYDGHPAAMHFHHVDPVDKQHVWMKLRLKSWSSIVEELDKCVLLCANCHAIIHSKSKYDTPVAQDFELRA